MQDPTHRAGREMMHWGLWPARGELVKPQSGARGRRARPWPSDAARPSRVRVAPRALRRTIVGLKPTQQRPLAAAPQLNFLYFEQYDRIGAERSILYRQTFDRPAKGPFFTVKLSVRLTGQPVCSYSPTFYIRLHRPMLHPYCGEHEKSRDEVKFAPPGPDGPLGAYAPCVRGGCVNGHSHLLGDSRMAWLRLLKVENPSSMLREPVGNSFNHPYRSLATSSFGAIGPPRAARRLR